MRDVIARALSWVLSVLAPRRPGRHSAAFLADQPEPAPVDPWSKPWPTPIPEHIRALYTPLRGEDVALTRPYVLAETTMELGVIGERRRAAALATLGVDYPYTYEGAPFPRSAFVAAAAVTV
ncbi:hypothetical protein AB0P36_14330 [Streptomyces flavidovirens]|uniref:hypothetical protein n=1 Tax=Streptomyces flavidovirens TaxID=67298 RepID=UPI003411FA7D